jgi:hypothetical protein
MARRLRDTVLIESVRGGGFSIVVDRATQYEILTDLTGPSAARFELGDDGTWSAIREALAIGGQFSVSVNDKPRITGRLLTRNLAVSADAGGTVQVVVRTKLADAMFTAVDPKIGVSNTTLQAVVLAAFARMGLTSADFIFATDLARDLVTGKGKGGTATPDLAAMKEDEARPHPPESVWAFVERHLSRFHLMMWDAPDGRIVIGAPNDEQSASYFMTAHRGIAARTNNLLAATKTEDFEDVPTQLWVYGVGGGRDQSKARIKFLASDPVLAGVDPFLDRTAMVIDESIVTQSQAVARARRELMKRRLASDSWVLEADGLSYWTGSQRVAYGIDTVAFVSVDIAGGANGPYLVYQCKQSGSADRSHATTLTACGRGIWAL